MATDIKIPSQPTHPPDVHLRSNRTKPSRTLKGDLISLRNRVTAVGNRWGEGQKRAEATRQKVTERASEIVAPVGGKVVEERKLAEQIVEPVQKAVASTRGMLDPKNGRTRPWVTSFFLSSIASWALGPQILTALYAWLWLDITPEDWGLLKGPGRWFRDTLVMAEESGQNASVIWAAVMGLLPMVLMFTRNMAAGHLAQGTYQGRMGAFAIRWLTRSAWLAPVIYFTGVAYPDQVEAVFGSPWAFEMWQFWVAGLFCTAFYCTLWVFDRIEKRLPLGATHVLLMIPLASIITGFCLNAPDAAW